MQLQWGSKHRKHSKTGNIKKQMFWGSVWMVFHSKTDLLWIPTVFWIKVGIQIPEWSRFQMAGWHLDDEWFGFLNTSEYWISLRMENPKRRPKSKISKVRISNVQISDSDCIVLMKYVTSSRSKRRNNKEPFCRTKSPKIWRKNVRYFF